MRLLDPIRLWAEVVKRDLGALWLGTRDPRVTFRAKVVAVAVVAYALSPIDLIPDFIPVLGMLDDVILVPLGLALALRLIPPPVLADLRAKATSIGRLPASEAAAMLVILVWILAVGAAVAVAGSWILDHRLG